MIPQNKAGLVICGVVAVCFFSLGRYTVPETVKVVTKTVEVEKKVEDNKSDTDKHKETITVTKQKPDGTKETTTKTVEDTRKKTDDKQTDTSEVRVHSDSETVRGASKVSLSFLAGAPISLSGAVSPIFGGHVTRTVLGPFSAGIWGLSNKTGGFSLGVTF